MKKLIILLTIILAVTGLSAKYILRDSESNIKFEEFEYLQDGILYRFDFKQVNIQGMDGEKVKMWKYKEIWLSEEVSKSELNKIIKDEKMEDRAKPTNIKIWKDKTSKPIKIFKQRRSQ